jgi:hypothetical protein
MKRLLLAFCIVAHSCAHAQTDTKQFKLKQYVAPASMIFLAGICEGVMDGLDHHYDKPNQFWNPDISYTNKYKNHDPKQGRAFPGSLTWLAWTTDGWHLMKAGRNMFTTGAIVFSIKGENKKWYWYIIQAGAYAIINRAGFNIAYSQFKYAK